MIVKTAISIPDSIFEAAEQTAKRLGISRSRLYTKAVERFVTDIRRLDVTERLDEVYGDRPARIDSLLESLQIASLEGDEW